jgi:repressor LexA
MQELTRKQKTIYETIRDVIEQEKENPTTYKIHKRLEGSGVKVGSLKGTVQVVESLEKKGMIVRDQKRIFLVENENFVNMDNVFSIPAYGLASCGDALAYADDNVDGYLQISKSLFRDDDPVDLFAVKALGDSMDKEGINDGDYIVFEKNENGEDLENKIVVAVINGMATIKRYHKLRDGMIGLFPNSTNSFHQPIYLDENDQILVAGVFRKVLPVKFVSL